MFAFCDLGLNVAAGGKVEVYPFGGGRIGAYDFAGMTGVEILCEIKLSGARGVVMPVILLLLLCVLVRSAAGWEYLWTCLKAGAPVERGARRSDVDSVVPYGVALYPC